MNKLFCKWLLIGFSGILTVGCAADNSGTVPDMSVEQLYMRGYDNFKAKDYESSAKYFDEVERQHPYSAWAPRAQIMAAYAYYTANNYDDAVLTLDRFIQLHPGNRNIAYAYYLKGLCYFEQISDVSREQKMTEDALLTFKEVLARFPNSIYVPDINAKLKEIEAHLAGKEMAVGRYYLKHAEYIPAMNRFQTVLLEHPHTNQTPEALYRLTVCYEALGMHKQALGMVRILQRYYGQDKWTQKAIDLTAQYQPKTVQTKPLDIPVDNKQKSVETKQSESVKPEIKEVKSAEPETNETEKGWTDYIWPF